jgi:hypothetical protein
MFLISQLDAHRLDLYPVDQDEAMYIVACSITKGGLNILHYHISFCNVNDKQPREIKLVKVISN